MLSLALVSQYHTDNTFLTSPGSAVAVEQIFSGEGDTISLHHASLKPETISTLMLIKQHLHLSHTRIHDIIIN